MELVYDSGNINMTLVTLSLLCLDRAKNVLQHPIILTRKRLAFNENTPGGAGGVSSILYCTMKPICGYLMCESFTAGAPPPHQPLQTTPNHPLRQDTAPGSTTASLKTPPSDSPLPSPTRSLNLHYNEDKEGGGSAGLRWRGVKNRRGGWAQGE